MATGRVLVALAATLFIGGCAIYHRHALPRGPDLAGHTTDLHADVANLALPGVRARPLDWHSGLNGDQLAELAVLNNPDLRAARAGAGVAGAQAFAAGLVPDPQASASLDRVDSSGPGLVNGHSVGLNYDIGALLTHHDRHESARHHLRQVNLDLLWQEWQVAQQTRLTYVKIIADRRKQALLAGDHDSRRDYCRHVRAAADAGDIDPATADAELANCADVLSRITATERDLQSALLDLHRLIGLSPDAKLKLAGSSSDTTTSLPDAGKALKHLDRRRPDLLALRQGYASQDASLRAAVLSQFPDISVGVNRASDTSNVKTTGFSISLNLPIFSARGDIAVARATRRKLRAEYQARLDQADTEVRSLLVAGRLLKKQLREMRAQRVHLQNRLRQSAKAWRQGDLDSTTYFQTRGSLRDLGLTIIDMQSALQRVSISLDTVLGLPLDSSGRRQTGGKNAS